MNVLGRRKIGSTLTSQLFLNNLQRKEERELWQLPRFVPILIADMKTEDVADETEPATTMQLSNE